MHPNLILLPVPPYLTSAFATSPSKENKRNKTTTYFGSFRVSHSMPLCPNNFSCKVSLHWVVGLLKDSGPCHIISSSSSLGLLSTVPSLPVPWRSCSFGSGEPAPSCAPAVHRGVDAGMGQPEPWIWAWVGNGGWLTCAKSPGSALQCCPGKLLGCSPMRLRLGVNLIFFFYYVCGSGCLC